MLLGADSGMEISAIRYTGHEVSKGIFRNFGDAVGLDSGVAFSSGQVIPNVDSTEPQSSILGPHRLSMLSGEMETDGDEDLNALLKELREEADVQTDLETFDAAVLEIDFVPTQNGVKFNYVFGSREYPDYVGDLWNDIFAFFVNGENYAILPDGTPVSINTVNADSNASYFIDNEDGQYNTVMHGFTRVLGFEAPVKVGETNTLKIAIADVGDRIYDSSVLIQSGSLTGTTLNHAPVALNQELITAVNTAINITLQANDVDGDDLTFVIVNTDGLQGTLKEDQDGTWIFTPADGFEGETSFTFKANDGQKDSNEAVVVILVDSDAAIEEGTSESNEATVTTASDSKEKTAPAETTQSTDTKTEAAQSSLATLSKTGSTSGILAALAAGLIAVGSAIMIWRRKA